MENVASALDEFRGRERIGIEFIDRALYVQYMNSDEIRPDYWDRMYILQINVQDLVGRLDEMVCSKEYAFIKKRRVSRDDYTYVTFYVNWSNEEVEEVKEVAKDYATLITDFR